MNLAFTLVWLLPALPLLAAAGIALFILNGAAGDKAEGPTARLAEGCAWLVLLGLAGLAALAWREGAPGAIRLGVWFQSGEFRIPLTFTVDRLSLSFGWVVAFVGVVTLRFSRNYLHREAGFHRFFLLMNLFLGGMLLIVFSGGLVPAFVGWELCGVSSFLLIGYAYDRPMATGNGLFAFLTNRIGDAGFILGISLAAWWLGTLDWNDLAAWAADGTRFDRVEARLLLFGLLLAAVVKSAQLPFSAWIARALEGPTPSSAIFYGSLMIHAGVYLVLRLAPILRGTPDIMVYLALIGAATAVYGWLCALVQTDVKSSLVFATLSQVGLMFLACGLGWFELAAWHMVLHALWRAWQFLLAPSYMHAVHGPAAPVPAWLARRQWLYTAALRRFWLEPAVRGTLTRPVLALARDMRELDEKALSHLVGMPARDLADEGSGEDVIQAHGLAGRLLMGIADFLTRLESYLILEPGGGLASRVPKRVGGWLWIAEGMLEHPRYLAIAVALTFFVIL